MVDLERETTPSRRLLRVAVGSRKGAFCGVLLASLLPAPFCEE